MYDDNFFFSTIGNTILPTLSVVPDSITFDLSGGSDSVILNASGNWNVSSKPDWVFVTPSTGSGDATLDIGCMSSSYNRSGTIIITSGSVTAQISVIQQDIG